MRGKHGVIILLAIILLGLINYPSYASGISHVRTGIETDSQYPASYLIDRNPETYWAVKKGSQQGWVELYLERPTLIHGIKLNGNQAPETKLSIEYREGNEWLPFTAATLKSIPSNGLIDLSVDRVVTQSIRIRLSGVDVASSKLSEVEVLGEDATSVYHLIKPVKLTAGANSSPNTPVELLCDGNTYTRWKTKNSFSSGEVTFELPSQSTIKNINIFFNRATQGGMKLEFFENNHWKELLIISSQPAGWYRIDLSSRNIKTDRLKLIVPGYSGTFGEIGEIQFWGYGPFKGSSHQRIGDGVPVEIAAILQPASPVNHNEQIKVLYSSANINPIINSIQHNLQLINTSAQSIKLSDVKLRYWYTNETKKDQVAQIYWSNKGAQNITTQFSTVNDYENADTYLELGFLDAAGFIAPGETVEIKLGINAKDWSNYNQENDYSFQGNREWQENQRYTGYIGGICVWGREPGERFVITNPALNLQFEKPLLHSWLGAGLADGRFKVLYQSANPSSSTNSIQLNLKVVNTSFNLIDLSKVKLRYWYSDETGKEQVANIYWSNIGAQKITTRFVSSGNKEGASSYLELGFSEGTLAPGDAVEIKLGFNAKNWANYQQSNDYSFANFTSAYCENIRITGYYDNQLSWGVEPNAQSLSDNTSYRLELVFAGLLTDPVQIELNGRFVQVKPSLVLRDRTIYYYQIPVSELWDGTNYLRIQPLNQTVILESVLLTYRQHDGEISIPAGTLNDGLLLTGNYCDSDEWQLDQEILVEEVKVITSDHSRPKILAWVNGDWVEFRHIQSLSNGYCFYDSVKTDRIKLEAYGNVNELQIKGSVTTNQEPTVQIFWPRDGEEIAVEGWTKQVLIGFVDNSEAVVDVNGIRAELEGHYFAISLDKVGLKKGETVDITAIARDPQGRTGRDTVRVTLGKFDAIELDQPDQLVYTDQSTFTISGYIKQPNQGQVIVEGTVATVSGNRFLTTVMLHEGLNLIKIQYINANKTIQKTLYRRVVRYRGEIGLTINNPEDGGYYNTDTIQVTGNVTGLAPLQVMVNGNPATVNGHAFSASVSLREGANSITVIAIDKNGKKAEQRVTVYRDTQKPVISNVTPTHGKIISVATVTVSAKISDGNPMWVAINGRAVTGEQGVYQTLLQFEDGIRTVVITAQDAAGNLSTYSFNVIVDTVAPEPFTPVAEPNGWTNNNRPVIRFETTDRTSGIDHYEIVVGDGTWIAPVSSPYQFAFVLPDGIHTIQVKAVDKAGHVTIGEVKVYIDTTPPDIPQNFRPVPGNGKVILRWDVPSEDTVEYRIERDGEYQFLISDGKETSFTDLNLTTGAVYKYRIWAIDHAGNVGESTEWKEVVVGVAVAQYIPEQGAVVEYENVTLVLPDTGVPDGIVEIQVSEATSPHLEEKMIYPQVSPIYEFSAFKEGKSEPEEGVVFEKGYLASIEYDESKVPEGFPEQNLGVYYYDPMFDRWFLIESAGVDVKNNRIFFITNHFSSFSVQATVIQDLSPQELKDAGYSPFKTYVEHEGITISPQGGTASTRVVEMVLPGRNGFDLTIARHYDTAAARVDAFALVISGKIGINILNPDGNLKTYGEILESIDKIETTWSKEALGNLVNIFEKYLFNQGDYAYSMGQGWRLNLPYVKAANSHLILCLPDGSMHSFNEMKIIGVPVSVPGYRSLTLKQYEGDDFVLSVEQVNIGYDLTQIINVIGADPQERIKIMQKTRWYSIGYKLRMKDGTVYEMDMLGRVTKIIDPTGKNEIKIDYDGLHLDRIVDSMGRVVRINYDPTFYFARIDRIWVENDSYHREVNYRVSDSGLLKSATDTLGRLSTYDYDRKLLVGGNAGFRISILEIIGKIIANVFGVGWLSSIFGNDDIEIYGTLQAQLVNVMTKVSAPGRGVTVIHYDQETITHGKMTKEYLKILGIKILKALDFSINVEQRLLADRVTNYLYEGGPVLKTTTYKYSIDYYDHGQPFIRQTVQDDGKKKIIYYYTPVIKERYSWEDRHVDIGMIEENAWLTDQVLKLWFPLVFYRVDVLPLNHLTEYYDSQTGQLLECHETEYDIDKMRPYIQIVKRGDINYRKISYQYDSWGNIIFQHDYSISNGRVNQMKAWMYYLDTSSAPSTDAPWLTSPFTQGSLTRKRNDLLGGKIVANYVSSSNEDKVVYLHSYYQYSDIGQLIGEAQWDGNQWLITTCEYHPVFGSLTRKINAENHETEYQYDEHGLPAAVIEKNVKNAKGETSDIITRTGHEYYSGWQVWKQDPNGYVTQYEYDALGRVTKIIAPDDDPGEKGWNPVQGSLARDNNPITTIVYDDKELWSLVTNAEGAQVKYNFDNLGRMVKITKWYTDPIEKKKKTAVTTMDYDAWGNIISITDPNGNDQGPDYQFTTWYTYDALGRNTEIIYPDLTEDRADNPRKIMNFDYKTNISTIIDENGKQTIEEEDMHGRVIRQTKTNHFDTFVTTYYFDGLGNEVETILESPWRTSITRKTYNSLNQLVRIDLPEESFWVDNREVSLVPYQRFEYNKAGHKIADVTGSQGQERIISYVVDGLGRTIKTVERYTDNGEVKEAVTETYYDANGNKVKVVDGNNTPLSESEQKYYSYTYTAANLLATETDPAGNVTSYTYDKVGNRLTMTDPRGNSGKYHGDFTIIYEYDELDRLVAGYLPKSGSQTEKPKVQLRYDARGNLVQKIEPDGLVISYTYWPRNRVRTETMSGDGKKYVVEHYYDAVGNEIMVKDARGNIITKEYDDLNRLEKVTYPEPSGKVVEQFEYDEFNNRTAYINGRYVKTNYTYDRYNRLREVRDALGGKTIYRYDQWGNLAQLVNAQGHTTNYEYDELNRLLRETNALDFTKQYRYDAVGNRVWSKDPNGTDTVYEYYPNNLVKRIDLANDGKTQHIEYRYDEAGYRIQVKTDQVTTSYNMASGQYVPDPYGRITSETKNYQGKQFTVEYQYDVMGRLTGVKYPTGHWVKYQYNPLGELTRVPGYIDQAPVYDAGGLLKSITAANGITSTWDYDQNGRLKEVKYDNQGTIIKQYSFAYDGANNIISKNQDSYEYDLLNQLIFANMKGRFEVNPENELQRVGRTMEDFGGLKALDFAIDDLELIELDYASGSVGVDLQASIPVTRIELKPTSPIHRVDAQNIRIYVSHDNLAYTEISDWSLTKQADGSLEIAFAQPVTARYVKVRSLFDDRDRKFNIVNKAQFVNVSDKLMKVYYLVTNQIEQYTYDHIGNRTSETITQRYANIRTYTYEPNSSRLKSNGKYNYEYDPNGNLIQKTAVDGSVVWEYQYDLLNRLISVKKNGKTVSDYLYDDSGLRLQKTSPAGVTYYAFDQSGNILYEEENRNYLEYIYVLGKHFARLDGNLDNLNDTTK